MENWNETVPLPEEDTELLKIRKALNQRNRNLILTSLLLAASILLTVIYGIVPAVETLYWGPYDSDYGAYSDLELAIQSYTELYHPGMSARMIAAGDSGFASYGLHLTRTDEATGEKEYINGTLERGVLDLDYFYFDRSQAVHQLYADYSQTQPEGENFDIRDIWTEDALEVISQLPEYIQLKAIVFFSEDLSMEQFQQLLFHYNWDGRNGVSILWAAVRAGNDGPPIGFSVNSHNGYELNETYPEFFIDNFEPDGSHMALHFKSLLRFNADQVKKGRSPFVKTDKGEYSEYVLDYVEEHGVSTYACLVSATPQGLQSMLDDGTASYISLLDGWIDVG